MQFDSTRENVNLYMQVQIAQIWKFGVCKTIKLCELSGRCLQLQSDEDYRYTPEWDANPWQVNPSAFLTGCPEHSHVPTDIPG